MRQIRRRIEGQAKGWVPLGAGELFFVFKWEQTDRTYGSEEVNFAQLGNWQKYNPVS